MDTSNPYGLRIAAAQRLAGGGSGAPPTAPGFGTSPSSVQNGSYGGYGGMGGYNGSVPGTGAFSGPGMGVRQQLKRMYAQNAIYGNGGLIGSINQLGNEANQDWTNTYAQMAAPQFERLNDYQNQAQGQLTQDLASRGLDGSSAMAAGLGTLAAQGAGARSNLANTVQNQALNRHDQLLSAYQQAVGNLVNGGRNSVDIQNQLNQERMLRQQMQGDPFGQALGGILGVGGSLLGSPWFGKMLGF